MSTDAPDPPSGDPPSGDSSSGEGKVSPAPPTTPSESATAGEVAATGLVADPASPTPGEAAPPASGAPVAEAPPTNAALAPTNAASEAAPPTSEAVATSGAVPPTNEPPATTASPASEPTGVAPVDHSGPVPVADTVAGPIAIAPADASDAAPRAAGGVDVHLVGRTDVGLMREHNEDNLAVARLDDDVREFDALVHHVLEGRGTLLVVCDGMGGAAAGEVASSMAVATLPEMMRKDETAPAPPGVVDDEHTALARKLRFATEEANRRIFAEQQANIARAGMGTTMTTALLRGDQAIIAQVGDSRCYVFRRGVLTQVTRDQSLVNQLLETGQITAEQAKYFEHSNVILQALGVQEEVEVQLSRVALRRGDRMLLCSDGLVGVISDEEIGAVLGSVDDPKDAARILIELANGAGGPDNITVIVAYLGGQGLAEPTDADVIEYSTWRIDPAAPPAPPPEEVAPPTTTPTISSPAVRRAARRRIGSAQLVSMAIVLGLIAGSVLVGLGMFRRSVTCSVIAPEAGLVVVTDGRDSGMRTGANGLGHVRLVPGRHTVHLDASRVVRPSDGAEPGFSHHTVDVRTDEACVIRFDALPSERPTAAEESAESAR